MKPAARRLGRRAPVREIRIVTGKAARGMAHSIATALHKRWARARCHFNPFKVSVRRVRDKNGIKGYLVTLRARMGLNEALDLKAQRGIG